MNDDRIKREHDRTVRHRLRQSFVNVRQRTVSRAATSNRWISKWKFIFFIFAFFLFLNGCGYFESEEFPKELLGRWVTKNPRYKGCYMIIEMDTIVFHAADGSLLVNTIEKVESADEFGQKIYHITYSDVENIEYLLSVIYMKGTKHGRLQFYNQRYLEWNKLALSKED
jgi:hypothetical protein